MKIGDYVRTKNGIIGKFNIVKTGETIPNWNGGYGYKEIDKEYIDNNIYNRFDDKIIKSSPNIIDLIEEGDILKVNDFKDVYTIYEVEMFRNPYTNEKYLGIRYNLGLKPKRLNEIPLVNLSIVTKEQFENMEYRIGE